MVRLQQQIDDKKFDKRLGIWLVLVDSNQLGQPASTASLKPYLSGLKLKLPAAADPTFKTKAYLQGGAVPMHVLIDLETMQLYYARRGYTSAVASKIQEFLSSK